MTVEVSLFATIATLILFAAPRPLVKAGILPPVGLDLHVIWGTSWLLVCSYIIGSKILYRRLK